MTSIRLTHLSVSKLIIFCSILLIATGILLLLPNTAFGHGYVEGPASRAALCKSGQNNDCGSIIYEPQSLEAPTGFPEKGPVDGKIASANGAFSKLDEQSATRWSKVNLSSRRNTFTWKISAAHATTSWKY
ncbi:chitin-binding protein [Paenibacillus macquariensis]|uniref:Chitin-binding protein n=1 Tax=Paenibacillus macquariensis TaxID=948756 RepID=A0ABY1JU62_9BACL|nr:chitin-binding protein [Paenibacillus macquariensis]